MEWRISLVAGAVLSAAAFCPPVPCQEPSVFDSEALTLPRGSYRYTQRRGQEALTPGDVSAIIARIRQADRAGSLAAGVAQRAIKKWQRAKATGDSGLWVSRCELKIRQEGYSLLNVIDGGLQGSRTESGFTYTRNDSSRNIFRDHRRDGQRAFAIDKPWECGNEAEALPSTWQTMALLRRNLLRSGLKVPVKDGERYVFQGGGFGLGPGTTLPPSHDLVVANIEYRRLGNVETVTMRNCLGGVSRQYKATQKQGRLQRLEQHSFFPFSTKRWDFTEIVIESFDAKQVRLATLAEIAEYGTPVTRVRDASGRVFSIAEAEAIESTRSFWRVWWKPALLGAVLGLSVFVYWCGRRGRAEQRRREQRSSAAVG